jgi:hypothetical protein
VPRMPKQATTETTPRDAALSLVVREAEAEAAKAKKVSQATRLTYEAKARQLASGWDLASACKSSRYAMRAAGLFTMRRQLRKAVKEAKHVLAKGLTGVELAPVRVAQWHQKVGEVNTILQRLRDFEALPWSCIPDPKRRLEASHKQRPATDAELVSFYEAAARSSFFDAFLVAEFAGVRGEELGEGVRVEAVKKGGVATLVVTAQSAKCDGDKKGLDLRQVEVPFPSEATKPVQARWLALAKKATARSGGCVVRVEKTAKQTAGVRFTNAVRNVARPAGLDIAAYSFRNRFSAQVKQASGGDSVAVALALGHQTTETQRHYARAARGGGGVSPVQVVGVNVGGHVIRGATHRAGPNRAHKERVQLRAAVAAAPPAAVAAVAPRGPRL